jgi:hypothetical protein
MMKKWILFLSLLLLIGTASAVTQLYLTPYNASEPMPNVKQSADTIQRDVATSTSTYLQPGVMSATVTSIQGVSTTAESTVAEAGATHYSHYGSWISNPLAEQWVNGTVTVALVMRESSSSANVNPRLKIYKWYANDTKGEELRAIGNSATEVPTSYPAAPVVYFNAVALTSTYFMEGDRIAIELESYDNNAVTTSWLHGIRYGSITGGYRSYINLSANLTYASKKPVVAWQGNRNISIALGSSLYPALTLATESKKKLDAMAFPYTITSGLTQTKLLKYRCTIDICGYWIQSYRDGQEIATNSPIWIYPPPFEALISDTDDTIRNEEDITLTENSTLAMEQILKGYVDRQPLGPLVVGTKE